MPVSVGVFWLVLLAPFWPEEDDPPPSPPPSPPAAMATTAAPPAAIPATGPVSKPPYLSVVKCSSSGVQSTGTGSPQLNSSSEHSPNSNQRRSIFKPDQQFILFATIGISTLC